ncbi:hypothetical protein [Hymenobacter sp. BT188]|uniref:hypothetical protein n=1 Tax=Hymenobacter sp. BT188 TaxID=2763504 RepID=UPI001650F69F|nr:hypothetical protein [Hymenobacter sp. BT188]
MYSSLLLFLGDIGDTEVLVIAFGFVSLVLIVVLLWPDKPAVRQQLSKSYVDEELRVLQKLRSEGRMNEEQFEAEKKRLLQE